MRKRYQKALSTIDLVVWPSIVATALCFVALFALMFAALSMLDTLATIGKPSRPQNDERQLEP